MVVGVDLAREQDTNVTSSGLTFIEENLFEKSYNAELACNRVQLCKNEIEKFQRYNEPDCPEEWKPQRLDKKFKWWKQKLKKAEQQDKFNADRLQRENEASKENQITAKELEVARPILEKHSHIGIGPRKHKNTLNDYIDNFDKEFSKNRKNAPTASALAAEMKSDLIRNHGKLIFVIEVEDANDCIKWRDHKGNIKSTPWGDPIRSRITRIRKERKIK